MRIVLVATTAPVTCVYCHDLLGAGPLERCTKCGTRYHHDCATLAGACGLIGCDGTFETTSVALVPTADARLALVVWPEGPPSREQLAAVARVLRATEWDARQRLGAQHPLVLGYFARPALAHATAELEAAGLPVLAVDSAVLARREGFVVRSAERSGEELLLRDPNGKEARLALGGADVLVSARYATALDQVHDMNAGRMNPMAPGTFDAPRVKRHTHTTSFTRVLHVYRESVPIVFDEAAIDDFCFLGEQMTASAGQNLTALAALLGQGARVVDRSLEKLGAAHLRHVYDSTRRRASVRTNREWVEATSLLVYHAHAKGDGEQEGKSPGVAGGARP